MIAEYAAEVQPEALVPNNVQEIYLKALVTRREQLVEMQAAELNRLGTVHNSIYADILELIEWLSIRIEEIDIAFKELIKSLPKWKEQVQLLESRKGVGFLTAVTVLAEMSQLLR